MLNNIYELASQTFPCIIHSCSCLGINACSCIYVYESFLFVLYSFFLSDESERINCNTEKDLVRINYHTAGKPQYSFLLF